MARRAARKSAGRARGPDGGKSGVEHVEELWTGGFRLVTDDRHFKLGTDSAMLAAFPALRRGERVCDLGCGVGTLPLLLLARCGELSVDGVELQGSALALCARSLALNGLEDRVRLHEADLRRLEGVLPAGAYDLVISNPPYFAAGSGYAAAGEAAGRARDERDCTVEEVCTAASRLTRWGGRFAAVFRPERLVDLLCAMRGSGLEPKRLRFVCHRADSPPSSVLVESRRGGKPGLALEPPLVLCDADGAERPETRKIYRRDPPEQPSAAE